MSKLSLEDFTHSFKHKLEMDEIKTRLTREVVEPYIKDKNVIDWGCKFGPRTYYLNQYNPESIRGWDPNFYFKEVFKNFVASNQVTWIDDPTEELWCDTLYLAAVSNESGSDPYTWFDNLLDQIHCKNIIATWGLQFSDAKHKWIRQHEISWYCSTVGLNFEDPEKVYKSSNKVRVVEHNKVVWAKSEIGDDKIFNTLILETI